MNRELLLDSAPDMIRAAILEDGKLAEILTERQADTEQAESIYLGRVQMVRKSLGAAFVDIGEELNAFLPLEEGTALHAGDLLIVQGAARQTTDSKGLRITSRINLAGKWIVLTPDQASVHVSKKVKDPAVREALRDFAESIRPDGCGLIVRTASSDVTEEKLREEVQLLVQRWKAIGEKAAGMTKPGLLDRREKLDLRLVRDLAGLTRVITNSKRDYEALEAALRACQPAQSVSVEYFDERSQLIFDAFSIEGQIDKALKKRVWLPCGGYIIFDACEAMTVIDVNSGKMVLGKDKEDTALRVNLEAADEIARQIRLRDIGGIILTDFIDMREEANRKALVERMKAASKADRAQVTVEGLTRLGLLEMTRKRVHAPLRKSLRISCSYCSGSGEVLSGEETARRALRQVRRLRISGQRGPFVIQCAPGVFSALCGLYAPEDICVYAAEMAGRHAERFDITQIGEGIPLPKGAVTLRPYSFEDN